MTTSIVHVHDPIIFPILGKLFDRLDAKELPLAYTKEQFLDYILENFTDHEHFAIWLAVDEGSNEVRGFMVTVINERRISGEKEGFIQLAYLDPPLWNSNTAHLAIERVGEWARHRGATALRAYALRGSKALERKFGFETEATVVAKSLENGA